MADLAAVQRLIVEGRLTRDAMLSNHGMRWTRAGDREDLSIFFTAADAIAFHERNLRTEVRPVEEEIVVDMEEADDRTPGVPVAIGPGLDPLGRQDLDTMIVDFGMGRDDTVEQTVRSGGVDETPIPEVPAGFARVEPDPTERLRPAPVLLPAGTPAGNAVSGIPVPAAINTITPSDAPKGSAAFGGGPRVPPTLVPAPNPSVSQSFFMDPTPVVSSPKPPPDRDVFDEPSGVTDRPRSPWLPMMAGGAVLLAILLVGAVVVFRPPAEPEPAPKEPVAAADPTPAPAPEPTRAPEATPSAEPTPAPEATPEPTPPPEARPAPAVPPPAPAVATPKPPREQPKPAPAEPRSSGSPKALIASGWKAVEAEDFTKAHGLFDRALSASPSATAYYGRAYANEKLGDAVSAAEDYCNALTTGSVDVGTSREIEAGLRRIGRSCP